MTVVRERCGNCKHGAHNAGPCQTVVVSGPPSAEAPSPGNPHPGRVVTPCDCQESKPYRNGTAVV